MAKIINRKKDNATHVVSTSEKLFILAIMIGLAAIVTSSYAILNPRTIIVYRNSTSTTTTIPVVQGYNIQSTFPQPAMTLADAPIITENQTFGQRLTDINAPFNALELNVINNAPDAYFEKGGQMLLNNTLANHVAATPKKLSLFMVNGKPTVIYFGSTTCIFCAENKWAMALALSRFGNFSPLFKGYSALQDGDLPTVSWAPTHYGNSSTEAGAFYTSNYINFIAIEDNNPITGGFELNSFTLIQQRLNETGSLAYEDAMKYIISTNDFRGTPFTVWGAYEVTGANAVVFGDAPITGKTIPLQYMTHADVLGKFANPDGQFAWSEYAAADLYVAMMCKTLNDAAPVCSLPAIQSIEAKLGL